MLWIFRALTEKQRTWDRTITMSSFRCYPCERGDGIEEGGVLHQIKISFIKDLSYIDFWSGAPFSPAGLVKDGNSIKSGSLWQSGTAQTVSWALPQYACTDGPCQLRDKVTVLREGGVLFPGEIVQFMQRRRILCILTVFSWFLISFVMGGSGPSRTNKLLYALAAPSPSVLALKPPS